MRVLIVAAALVFSACGELSTAASGGASPSATAPAGTVMVTTADEGKTVNTRVGDHIQIALGEKYDWHVDAADGTVLVRPVQNYMLVRGTQAIYLAASPGTATIRATGTAVCASGSPCPLFAVLFNATVIVSR